MRHIEINKEWNSRQPFVGKLNDISMEEIGLTKEVYSSECTLQMKRLGILDSAYRTPKKYETTGWSYPKIVLVKNKNQKRWSILINTATHQ